MEKNPFSKIYSIGNFIEVVGKDDKYYFHPHIAPNYDFQKTRIPTNHTLYLQKPGQVLTIDEHKQHSFVPFFDVVESIQSSETREKPMKYINEMAQIGSFSIDDTESKDDIKQKLKQKIKQSINNIINMKKNHIRIMAKKQNTSEFSISSREEDYKIKLLTGEPLNQNKKIVQTNLPQQLILMEGMFYWDNNSRACSRLTRGHLVSVYFDELETFVINPTSDGIGQPLFAQQAIRKALLHTIDVDKEGLSDKEKYWHLHNNNVLVLAIQRGDKKIVLQLLKLIHTYCTPKEIIDIMGKPGDGVSVFDLLQIHDMPKIASKMLQGKYEWQHNMKYTYSNQGQYYNQAIDENFKGVYNETDARRLYGTIWPQTEENRKLICEDCGYYSNGKKQGLEMWLNSQYFDYHGNPELLFKHEPQNRYQTIFKSFCIKTNLCCKHGNSNKNLFCITKKGAFNEHFPETQKIVSVQQNFENLINTNVQGPKQKNVEGLIKTNMQVKYAPEYLEQQKQEKQQIQLKKINVLQLQNQQPILEEEKKQIQEQQKQEKIKKEKEEQKKKDEKLLKKQKEKEWQKQVLQDMEQETQNKLGLGFDQASRGFGGLKFNFFNSGFSQKTKELIKRQDELIYEGVEAAVSGMEQTNNLQQPQFQSQNNQNYQPIVFEPIVNKRQQMELGVDQQQAAFSNNIQKNNQFQGQNNQNFISSFGFGGQQNNQVTSLPPVNNNLQASLQTNLQQKEEQKIEKQNKIKPNVQAQQPNKPVYQSQNKCSTNNNKQQTYQSMNKNQNKNHVKPKPVSINQNLQQKYQQNLQKQSQMFVQGLEEEKKEPSNKPHEKLQPIAKQQTKPQYQLRQLKVVQLNDVTSNKATPFFTNKLKTKPGGQVVGHKK